MNPPEITLPTGRKTSAVLFTIESEFDREWNSQQLADLVNLSVSRLRHLCKAETGKTPLQLLKLIRIHKAALLLETTHLSVKEVMYRVGLADASNFVHEFKRSFGMAPTEYRTMRMQRA
jgi:AraC-like DNA-binding protein